MGNIKFRMAARCEAAGRPNNEDNYQLDADLSDNEWGFTADKSIDLGKKGALLVVCDGMGGMNAGEVASDIAVSTIKEWFVSDRLTAEALASPMDYIKQSIMAADNAIKSHGKAHPETEGMGSTIVLAWMLGKKVYVGWCGDSRCYCYNSKTGLVRLSHDHSYVQELVDAGKLTEDLAFDHPHNNIITRSLGDPNGTARPDVKAFDLHNEDILLLCSDGLCGCLRDNEIEEQITAHQTSMQECRDALWAADEAAGWHDNVTIALAQVISGGQTAQPAASDSDQVDAIKATNKRLKIGIWILVLLLVGIALALAYKPVAHYIQTHPIQTDSCNVEDSVGNYTGDACVSSAVDKNGADSTMSSVDGDVQVIEQPTAETASKTKEIFTKLQEQPVPEVQKVKPDTAKHNATATQVGTKENADSHTESAKTERTTLKEETDEVQPVKEENSQETSEKKRVSQISKEILDGKQGDAISSPTNNH